MAALIANREKLGVEATSYGYTSKFFFNYFVSQILYNQDRDDFDPVAECEDLLTKVAIIDIALVRTDAILIEKTIKDPGSLLTFVGGLLSLYAGFSFLSLAELAFWIFSGLVRLCTTFLNLWFQRAVNQDRK